MHPLGATKQITPRGLALTPSSLSVVSTPSVLGVIWIHFLGATKQITPRCNTYFH